MAYQVIVAEDEPLLLQNTVSKVRALELGFEVVATAQTGIQALEHIERLHPDLLITDIRMPVMDGLELIERAREAQPGLDCVIISGYSDFEYAQRACRLQAFDYLLKPVDPAQLRDALARLKARYAVQEREMAKTFVPGDQSHREVAEALKAYLDEHYAEDVKMNLIAESLNYSAGHISRIFQQTYDVSPNRYLITLRINRACALLTSDSALTVRAVGEAVGYPEQGYFSRIFKKYTGMNPQQYRDESPQQPGDGRQI